MNMITITTNSFNGTLWRKSSRSTNGPDCIEVTFNGHVIGVRDSKNPNKDILSFSYHQWQNFIQDSTKHPNSGS
jgi:hypothetical protein